MECDFSGYATKAGLKCTDGRTIMPGAFRHQDQQRVPLVWQHGHNDPENVLGHAVLEERADGVYAYGFFNDSPKAKHAHGLLEHRDITQMSIWANELVQRAGKVLHGAIREVSLVLAGANPGALIENVSIRHSDGDVDTLDDEAIIYTGLELEHQAFSHADNSGDGGNTGKDNDDDNNDDDENDDDGEKTIEDVYESMSDEQKQVLHFMLGEAIEATKSELKQDSLGQDADDNNDPKGNQMSHNVFEKGDKPADSLLTGGRTLSHAEIKGIVADATKRGSLKDAVEDYALQHGIDDIDVLFPEARAISDSPEFEKRRTEWVQGVLGTVRKSPFSRVKTLSADITEAEARAKGYIKGDLKKEEFFSVAKRVTTPTTVYKKQKLDRDDILDITDFDVVAWLKGEMRLMLDEELARAILIGDGRDVSSEDKINEGNIRPVAKDHALYATTINVNLANEGSSVQEVIDAIVLNRRYYKGTGLPTMYTTESLIAQFMLLKDTTGRRIYKTMEELAAELRVQAIVPVEPMEEEEDIVAILVNLNDYVIGADRGGQVSMFDDFDIDYNQHKYLIETRVSGALAKLKSALVVRQVDGAASLVVPVPPTYEEGEVTITNTTGVVYRDGDNNVVNAAGSPYTVPVGEEVVITAEPASSSYYFGTSAGTTWKFRNRG